VATGHTADDQAETVLHRLLRGTGLQGLRGIAARRDLEPGIGLVRPLLQATRQEVLAYLGELGQPYRLDKSNDDLRYTRNRIRHDLLPHLAAHYNPAIVPLLGRLAQQAEAAYRAEAEAAERLLQEADRPRAAGMLILDRPTLAAAGGRPVRALFRLLWAREGWPTGRMGFAQWQRLSALVHGEIRALDLPEGVHVRGLERVVQVWRQAKAGEAETPRS
jgi:tRNA(Ile)-lysidine synthase